VAAATDPLSAATRASKPNLLVASILAITYRAFDISLWTLAGRPTDPTVDPRALTFLLIAALLYLTASFILYYVIDVRNFEATSDQADTEGAYAIARMRAWQIHAQRTLRRVRIGLRAKYDVFGGEEKLVAYLQRVDEGDWHDGASLDGFATDVLGSMKFYTWRPRIEKDLKEDHDTYVQLHGMISRSLLNFGLWRALYNVPFWPRLYAIRGLYWLRAYVFDGLLPLAFGAIALAALFQVVDVHVIAKFIPA
jgi:hypothetical protein